MTIYDTDEDYKAHQAKTMLGTRKNPVENGFYAWQNKPTELMNDEGFCSITEYERMKLPHGWLVKDDNTNGLAFVPFAEDGTGWGKNDPTNLAGSEEEYDPFGD